MKYRQDIDGLRALAVMPVVLFHAGLDWFSGGFVGVDVFFVISGYLITTIIYSELRTNSFSIIRFYERRARRILPALVFLIFVTSIFAYALFLPQYLVDYSRSMLSVSLFFSNMYFWKFSGYFDSSAQLRPLLHTWSLSVEEQFYIFMPLAMLLLARLRQSWQVSIFVVVALLSLALSIVATEMAPTANFFVLPTRSWELLCGSLLAISRPRVPSSIAIVNTLGILGLAGVVLPVFLYTEAIPFPGLAAVPPCLGAALLIYSGAAPLSFANRLLSLSPLVSIGKISYSLYLVHWPIAVILRYITLREPTLFDASVISASSIVMAVLSWRFVEQPFRSSEIVQSRQAVFGWSAATLLLVAALGTATMAFNGFPNRYPELVAQEQKSRAAMKEARGLDISWRNGKCFFENDERYKTWDPSDCVINPDEDEPALLWGDSYAAHYIPGLVLNSDRLGQKVYLYTYAGCPPVLAYTSYARVGCATFNQNALSVIDRLKIKKVIISARWVDLRSRGFDILADTINILKAKGLKVIVIGQSPLFVTDTRIIDFRKSNRAEQNAAWPSVLHSGFIQTIASAAGGADRFIDPLTYLCKDELCPYKAGGNLLYSDEGHFSGYGSLRAVRAYLEPELRK